MPTIQELGRRDQKEVSRLAKFCALASAATQGARAFCVCVRYVTPIQTDTVLIVIACDPDI